MKTSVIGILLLLGAFFNVSAQEKDHEAIQQVIENLFDGMRAGDSSMVASTFIRSAIMETISMNQEGEVVKRTGSLAGFLNGVGTPHDEIWDEHISSYNIQVDADLASVWTPYKFYLGENFSHCGVNSFQLAKLDGTWKIIYIVDTRRRTDCIE